MPVCMALCVALPHLPCLVCTQMETDLTVLLRTLRLGTTVNPRSSYVSVIEELSSLEEQKNKLQAECEQYSSWSKLLSHPTVAALIQVGLFRLIQLQVAGTLARTDEHRPPGSTQCPAPSPKAHGRLGSLSQSDAECHMGSCSHYRHRLVPGLPLPSSLHIHLHPLPRPPSTALCPPCPPPMPTLLQNIERLLSVAITIVSARRALWKSIHEWEDFMAALYLTPCISRERPALVAQLEANISALQTDVAKITVSGGR